MPPRYVIPSTQHRAVAFGARGERTENVLNGLRYTDRDTFLGQRSAAFAPMASWPDPGRRFSHYLTSIGHNY
eukprot:CAMPEP_0182559596 /NCGR_PEP_ID=MMETSP1324-20130603/2660_1 /TAXON_ID=236786 /ORGANISM="Florenciella sp., Strain RCC1587" /LENGTH=71 /DNA_ID=CAMNT_0024771873 /DNA_START=784 /DNA_END=999 /DNA_ORIENTATION=+